MRILGLDLSLTSTGYVLLDEDQVVWYGSVGSEKLRDVERLQMFDDWIREKLRTKTFTISGNAEIVGFGPNGIYGPITHVAIEGYSFASVSHHHAIGELGGIIKLAIHQAGLQLHIIPPATWKKQLCGKGNLKKDQVRLELFKRYGIEFASQDTLDAWAVAMCLRRQLLGVDKPAQKIRKRKNAPLLEAMA